MRKGNENKEVFIYRYIAEGSFDSYSWQILETKQNFISQFLSGSTYQRCIADLEESVLTYAEVKALALSNPLMKEKAEKENELKNLLILSAKNNEYEWSLKEEYKELKDAIERQKIRLSNSKYNAQYIQEISNTILAKLKEFKNSFTPEFINSKSDNINIDFFNFSIYPPYNQDKKKPYLFIERLETKYILYVGESASGNARRLKNFFSTFDLQIKKDKEALLNLEKRKFDIENHESKSQYKEQIKKCRDELAEIEKQLSLY